MQAFKHSKDTLGQVGSVLVDGRYTGRPFERGAREILGEQVAVQIAKRSELRAFAVTEHVEAHACG